MIESSGLLNGFLIFRQFLIKSSKSQTPKCRPAECDPGTANESQAISRGATPDYSTRSRYIP